MRSDVGLSTISQRLAGLAAMRPSAAAAPRMQSGQSFADALTAQVASQTSALPGQAQGLNGQGLHGQLPEGQGFAGQALAAGSPAGLPTASGLSTQATLLGQGTRLTGRPSLVVPQLGNQPLTTQAPAVDAHDHDHSPVALDRVGPPAELQAHGNGRIPADALEPLGVGNHRLWSPAARAFRDMAAAAERDGVTIGINDSYRSYERQIEMVDRYGLYSQGGRAASPGTSNHGWGVALDLQLNDQAKSWMREHAADYGFVEDVPREPWHWTFKASGY